MKNRFLIISAFAALSLLSCNDNDDATSVDVDAPVEISGSINNGVNSTKLGGVDGDEWAIGEQIVAFKLNHGSFETYDGADDQSGTYRLYEAYTAGVNAAFGAVDSSWKYPQSGIIDVVAFTTDFSESIIQDFAVPGNTNWDLPLDMSGQQDGTEDVLIAFADTTVGGNSISVATSTEEVPLAFKHMMTKVIFTYNFDASIDSSEYADYDDMQVSFTGMTSDGTLDLTDGSIVLGSATDSMKLRDVSASALQWINNTGNASIPAVIDIKQEGYLIPQTSAFDITIKAAGRTMVASFPSEDFKSGYMYIYDLTLYDTDAGDFWVDDYIVESFTDTLITPTPIPVAP